jgi:hypothetical protein
MYAEVMHAQGLDVSATKSPDDDGGESVHSQQQQQPPPAGGGIPADALNSIRGKTKKLNGELKPIR